MYLRLLAIVPALLGALGMVKGILGPIVVQQLEDADSTGMDEHGQGSGWSGRGGKGDLIACLPWVSNACLRNSGKET